MKAGGANGSGGSDLGKEGAVSQGRPEGESGGELGMFQLSVEMVVWWMSCESHRRGLFIDQPWRGRKQQCGSPGRAYPAGLAHRQLVGIIREHVLLSKREVTAALKLIHGERRQCAGATHGRAGAARHVRYCAAVVGVQGRCSGRSRAYPAARMSTSA